MKIRIFMLAALFFFTTVITGEQTSIKPEKELKIVENQIKDVLSKLGDEVIFKYLDSKCFEVSYHTRKFMIHSGTMIGKFSEKAFERTGPDYDGFILWVNIQDAGVVNQANTPQNIKEPYWNSYLDVTGMSGTNKQIYWGLSYSAQTDEKILSNIKEALWKLGKSRKESVSINNDGEQPSKKKGEELTGIFKKNRKSLSPYKLELTGGTYLNLRGTLLENIKEDTMIWITGQIRTVLYRSVDGAAMPTQWDIFMDVENYKEISKPFEIPKLD